MRAVEQRQVEIASGDGLETRARRDALGGGLALAARGLARRGQQVLDVEQIRHERMQVTFDGKLAALEQGEDVAVAGLRNFLPERLPLVLRRAQREAEVRRHERP